MSDPNVTTDILRKNIQRELPCPLTNDERLQRAIEASKRRAARGELEATLDAAKEAAKKAIADDEAALERLDNAVRDGREKRLIACYERFRSGTVELVRDDNGEIVETRAATMAEAQRQLPGAELRLVRDDDEPQLDAESGAGDPEDWISAQAEGDDNDGTGVVRADDGEHVGDVVASSTGAGVFVAPEDEDDDQGDGETKAETKRGKGKRAAKAKR
jgi:hypothetical protein